MRALIDTLRAHEELLMFPDGGVHNARSWSGRRDLMIFLILALLMLIAWAARSQPAAGSSSDIAAKVNGVPITTLELDRSFQAHVQVPYATVQEDPRAKEVLRQILDNLIDRELLLQQAKSLKMAVPAPEVDMQMQQLQQRFPSKEAFEQALTAQQLTLDSVKKDVE